MDDAGAMGGAERFGHLIEKGYGAISGQAALAAECGLEGFACEEFHCQKGDGGLGGLIGGIACQIEDPAYVGMGDLARELNLPFKASDHGGVGCDPGKQRLESDLLVQFQVLAFVDFPHAATAEEAHDAIPARDYRSEERRVGKECRSRGS